MKDSWFGGAVRLAAEGKNWFWSAARGGQRRAASLRDANVVVPQVVPTSVLLLGPKSARLGLPTEFPSWDLQRAYLGGPHKPPSWDLQWACLGT